MKTAVVTGAGSGIGRATAIALASRGMRVVLIGRSRAALDETARSCAAGAAVLAVDLTGDYAISDALDPDRDVHVLVHSAAKYGRARVEATTAADWDSILATNVRAPALLTARLLPALRRAAGDVVFVNSSVVSTAGVDVSAYAASKAALKALADALRAEENANGVRVLSVYPGRTATPMQAQVHASEGRAYAPARLLQPADVAAAIAAAIALPRTAEVTDIHVRPALKT
ncbi:MAG TPA: SDR family oxidoreductase [Polyangiaceae bacterium]|nr:SDR family oxidoreductase [Polyangiaceae bacterium]